MSQAAKAILFFLMLPSGIWKKSNLLHLQMYGHAPKKHKETQALLKNVLQHIQIMLC